MRTIKRWRLPLLATAALATGAAVGGGTFAMWNAADPVAGAVITAGDLDVTDGEAVWKETSSDVDAAPHVIDPATFLVRQGDTVTVDHDFSIALEGDNMRGAIRVAWSQQPELPPGVTATYEVRDSDGIPLGTPGVLGDDAVVGQFDAAGALDADHTLHVALDFAGLPDRFGAGSAEQVVDLGEFSVALEQIRTGGGFE